MSFVQLDDINPMYFSKPYYMEPQKGGDKSYSLLRDALKGTGKVGIAKVVIKTRQYLAAVKPQKTFMILEVMHFEDELADTEELKKPNLVEVSKPEMQMAQTLIENMTDKWDPSKYTDDYRSALMKVIKEKVAAGGKELPATEKGPRKPTNVIDLVEVLKNSLAETAPKGKKATGRKIVHMKQQRRKAA
jgi:DNA end-binding protein Ku